MCLSLSFLINKYPANEGDAHIKQPVGKAESRVNGSRRRGEERRALERRRRATWWGAMGHRLKPTVFFGVLLRAVGLYKRGHENYLRPGLNELSFSFANLPPAFDGFRILYVADLHFDPRYEAFVEPVRHLIDSVEADLCCFGGDYFFEHFGEIGPVRDAMARLVEAVHAPRGMLGVLGNHDMSSVIAPFEALGIRLLMNEHVTIEKDGDKIAIIGVDDTSFYEANDMAGAMEGMPETAFRLLLAHTPELALEAADHGVDFYLCGHTHAGQVRLPIVGPVIFNSRCPRRFCERAWEHQGMQGYTTSGAGATDAPVRFNCPGEIVVITLRRQT